MNRKSQAERILHSLTELHQQQQEIQTKLAQLLESVLQTNDKSKGKQMIIEIEDLQSKESTTAAQKSVAIEQLVRLIEEDFFDPAEKRRRMLLQKKPSLFADNFGRTSFTDLTRSDEEGRLVESQWEINPKDIQINEEQRLGRGQFGTVYKGMLLGKEVAVKKLLVQSFNDSKAEEAFIKEIKVMSSLRHPNILLLMGACTKPGSMVMVTELMSRGSVYDLLHKNTGRATDLSLQRRRMLIAKQAAQGMNWLHKMEPALLHLDLKSSNLLVDENWVVKVADFGLSQMMKEQHTEKVGSPLYMAPEILRGEPYGSKADVYSFGIVLWELVTEKEPYEGKVTSMKELLDGIKINKRPEMPRDLCNRAKDVISSCWDSIPDNRPSFADLLNDKVFDGIILDHYISDVNALGKILWKERFGGRWRVPWKDFLKGFIDLLHIPPRALPEDDIKLEFFKVVLKGDEDVSLETWAGVLEWFGPMDGVAILDRIYQTCKKKYFYGHLSTSAAEQYLATDMSHKHKGSFVVRFSSSEPGSFALSAITSTKDPKIQHFRIGHKAGGKFTLGSWEFSSLDELVKSKELKQMSLSLNLSSPCSTPSVFTTLELKYKKGAYFDDN